jgi:phosphoserine phosphatase
VVKFLNPKKHILHLARKRSTLIVNPEASSKAVAFVDSVLQLQPQLAVFDCDGTLWSGDAGEGFFDWELDQGFLAKEIVSWARLRYQAYKAGKVSEEQICGEMVTVHRGLTDAEVQRTAENYFQHYFVCQIFPEMQLLVHLLQGAGCKVWAVSSSNDWLIKAAMKHFGISAERVLATAGRIVNGIVTDRLIRIPSGEGKTKAIHEVIGRVPDAAFGNSIWDAAMLGIVRHPFVINPTPQLDNVAKQRHWPIYFPDEIIQPAKT